MNKLHGIITEVISEGHLSLVKVKVFENILTSVVIDTPATAAYLVIGNKISVLFKESEVVIAKSFTGQISMQNKFDCVIKSIEAGKLLSQVIMDYDSFDIGSLITTRATVQLGLNVGDKVTAFVKTNEISLAPYD